MSGFDLNQQEIDNRTARMPARTGLEPGAFDNFLAGTGKVTMQTLAKAGSAIDLLGSVGPIVQDKFTGRTEAQDRYFQEHEEVFGKAVDYWTPKPNEVGAAGQVVGQLLGTLPLVFASPGLAVGATQVSTAEDLTKKGVDPLKAQAVGAVQAAGLGLGIWVPILGKTLAQRVLLGGAGFNAVQGVATRGASGVILEGTPGAEDFKAFDPTSLTLDVLLGAAFGGIAHVSPAMRAEGAAWQSKLADWGAKLKPSEIDALITMRQAQHINADSMPGKPVDMADADAHVQRLRQAIDDLANDRPISVEQMPPARFEIDPARQAEAEAEAAKVQADVAEVLRAEVDPVAVKLEIDEATGLPLNEDGTVTLYHHTSAKNADQIRKTGRLKAAGEPDVYVTTRRETDTGYGDTAVPIRVKPDTLLIDDEFPDGRKDFRLNVGKPGGSIKVAIHDETVAPKVGADTTAARPDFDQFARQYVESQPVDKFDHAQRIADAEAEIRKDYMLGNKDGSQFFEQLNEEDAARFFDEDGDLTDAGNARYVELQDQAVAKEARDQVGKPQQKQIDFSDPEHAAQVLRDYLDAAGLDPNVVGGSGKSRSKYFEIENGKRMIRVSDHELPDHYVNDSDIEVLLPQDSGAALAEIRALAERLVAEKGMAVVKESLTPEIGDAVVHGSKLFSEDKRLSNLSPDGPSWERIRENNPALARTSGMDDEIIIYRATVGEEIRPDDFVTVDKKAARAELKNVRARDGAGKIIEKIVKVRDLLMANDATEFVFFPLENVPAKSVETDAPEPVAAPAARAVDQAGDIDAKPLDPLAAEAQRFAAENPDISIVIGKTADGEDITTTPRQMMEESGLAVEQARADATLFEVAASCLLGAK